MALAVPSAPDMAWMMECLAVAVEGVADCFAE